MGNYSALKRNEVATQAAAWMNHKDIMPYERSQAQKVTCRVITFV